MSDAEQFPFNGFANETDKRLFPPSEADKRKLLKGASAIAKQADRKDDGSYTAEQPIPDTDADTLAIVTYDSPSQTPGVEGLILQITHRANVGEPDIYEEDNRKDYAGTTTKYLFSEIPDGIHVDRRVVHHIKVSERARKPIPQTSEEWRLALDACMAEVEAADQDKALERAMGMHFFSQHDAENLQDLLSRTWPQVSDNS